MSLDELNSPMRRSRFLGTATLALGGAAAGALATRVPNAEAAGPGTAPVYNVKDYGAVGNGTTDDTTDIQAAISACNTAGGGIVWFPEGTYLISSTLSVTGSSIALLGTGAGFDGNDVNYASNRPATKILWGGSSGSPMIKFQAVQGCRLEEMELDGGGVASYGVQCDQFMFSRISRVGMRHFGTGGIGLYFTASHTTEGYLTAWSEFRQLFIYAPIMIQCDGSIVTGNDDNDVTQCRFDLIGGVYGSSNNESGIVLNHADQNTWDQINPFHGAGTGFGMVLGQYARNNTFRHCGFGTNGIHCQAPAVAGWSNSIYDYDLSDQAGFPSIDSGATLLWTYTGYATQNAPYANQLLGGWYLPTRVAVGLIAQTVANGGAATINTEVGQFFQITVTGATGASITIANPLGEAVMGSAYSHEILIEIKNQLTGGTLSVTWGGDYVKIPWALTLPANGKSRWIKFFWNGVAWIETGRASADY